MNLNRSKPPIGGALLEAMFAYPAIELADTIAVANSLETCGCMPSRQDEWVTRTADFDYAKPPPGSSVEEYLEWAIEQRVEDANLSYVGRLHDQQVEISLSFYFSDSVVSLSTTEDFLWGFSGEIANADFRRLESYYCLCEAVCQARPPKRAIIGSETCHADEISVSKDTDQFAHNHEVFFSEAEKQSLFDWYVNVYGQRWG